MQTQTPVIFHLSSGSTVNSQMRATQPSQQTMERGDPQDSQLPVASSSSRTDTTAQVSEAREFVNPQEPDARPAGASSQPAARQTNGSTQRDCRELAEDCLCASTVSTAGLLCAAFYTEASIRTALINSALGTTAAGVGCCLCCIGMGAICPDVPSDPQ